ncbi:YtxH domain-containing protein [Hymenobacter actinosclerus]|uniref:YtxH-like protein n=1 Tax=Hymenobacter actinosclerus TaxID=82805 RepID=A0A1I0GU80_9BACT|nr:YtxH domain-containing protein [Hymenobacter actinosclerus]SET73829.1 YtxH-like protein [Hymenobacter actinosclerus]
MQDTKGKVIFSLLAGATAGIVAGLLLAPETGDEARADIKESAGKLNKDLARLLKEGKARLDSFTGKAPAASQQQASDRSAADDLLSSMNQPAGPGAGI